MTQAAEIMTPDPVSIGPRETLQRAAQLMDELNVGALPVCEDGEVLGIITDRDIAVRAVAGHPVGMGLSRGRGPATPCPWDFCARAGWQARVYGAQSAPPEPVRAQPNSHTNEQDRTDRTPGFQARADQG